MFQFAREKILPLFLKMGITTRELARLAGVNHATAFKAVNGQPVQAPIIEKIAAALKINALDYLVGSNFVED